MHHRFHGLAAALAAMTLGLPQLAAAQARPDPADPKAPARALAHRSAFADYQPFQDINPGDWRRLNDTVGAAALKPAAGGATASPSPAPAAAASAPPAKMPMQPMQGHHHPMHGGSK
ncbi:MAG: hypothetical protein L6Q68_07055 [Aquabacterium sp.]|nr:hypothetical protein [Aquabacterium sp.]